MNNYTSGAIENLALAAISQRRGLKACAQDIAFATGFLESVGYPGLKLLAEAMEETRQDFMPPALAPEYGLVDTQNISCVYIAAQLNDLALQHGRIVLMQVRHGLFCVPFSVRHNYAIGCPIDPSFALGGEREKNPYLEKLAHSAETGIEVEESIIHRIEALT